MVAAHKRPAPRGLHTRGLHPGGCTQGGCTQETCTKGAAHKGAAHKGAAHKGAAPGGGGCCITTKTGSPSSDYNFQGKNSLSFPVSLTARGQERVCSQAFKCVEPVGVGAWGEPDPVQMGKGPS